MAKVCGKTNFNTIFERIDWARFNKPTKHITGHIGDGFLRVKWPNQQHQSTEGRQVQGIRLQSNQVQPTVLTMIQQLCSIKQKHTKYTQINLRTVKWIQCDKTQCREKNYTCWSKVLVYTNKKQSIMTNATIHDNTLNCMEMTVTTALVKLCQLKSQLAHMY